MSSAKSPRKMKPVWLPESIPYGVSKFAELRRDGRYYVDKTAYIAQLEARADFLFFVRPRRFGKSLFVDMLRCYYDLNEKKNFKKYFGDLAIGKNPTKNANKYQVLALDFSQVGICEGSNWSEKFESYMKLALEGFLRQYVDSYKEIDAKRFDAGNLYKAITNTAAEHGYEIYLIIDEYDNFTNTILAELRERYEALCHGDGFFKQFFTVLKAATTGTDAPISRIFITGVSPVTMDDVTSGFNIAANISMNPAFSSLAGFTQDDLKAMLEYYHEHADFKFDPEKVRADISEWYDNYRFATVPMADGSAVPSVANSTLVLSFMRYFLQNHQYPPEFIDENLRVDYRKIRHIITESHKINGNFHRLEEILEKKGCTATLARSFQARDITRDDNFVTLLYYFGLLTICGSRFGRTILKIPNRTIEEFMHDFVPRAYEDVNNIDFHGDELLICEEC